MNLFGKKKEEEFDDEEELIAEEELKDRKLTRKFKDLKPENKRKRKEPPKPWGKKERIIVGSFFLVTTLAAALMFLTSHEFKFPGLPKISFKGINFSNPFGERVIELGQKKSASVNDYIADDAIDYFTSAVKPLAGVYGFVVIRLNSGDVYGVSTDSKFQGASLLKLPLMVLAYKKSEEGSLNLEDKYVLKSEDKVAGSGDLYNAPDGSEYTYTELIEFMGKKSDRTAYKVMKDLIGDNELKIFLTEIGAVNTDIDTGMTTPSDMGMIFQKVWNGEILDEISSQALLGNLTGTLYEDWITKGVPEGIPVAHKFGTDSGVLADGGIIQADNPYVLVIMGDGITKKDADNLFPKVSRYIYNLENNVQ